MAKIGRNDPCPCGSGKKYKKCCMASDEGAARAARPAAVVARRPSLASYVEEDNERDELTEASNRVVDMVQAGNLDTAEQAAHELLARFPDVHDGYDRLGMVCEARGDYRQAVDRLETQANTTPAEPAAPTPASASPGAQRPQGIHACGAEPP